MPIQIYGDGALAKEIQYGILSGVYSSLTTTDVVLLGKNSMAEPGKKTVLGIQDPMIKRRIYEGMSERERDDLINLFHTNVQIMPDLNFERGLIINANSVLSFGVKLGENVLVNWNVTVGHEVSIGSNSSIGPGCNIAGEVIIGENCFLGAGVIVNPKVKIGDGARIGSGAVVTKAVPNNTTFIGIPAREIGKS